MRSRLADLWPAYRAVILGALALASALALIGALVWPLTDLLAAHDVGVTGGAATAVHLQAAREAVRTQLLTAAAGIFVAGTLWFTAQNYRLARQGHVTDRYTNAIAQLGADQLHIRIGAVYALERIARDSAADHPVVMEVLAAFTREHSHELWPPPGPDGTPPDPAERRTRPDLEAAMTVIGCRNPRRDKSVIDISRAELIWVYLPGADLTGLDLYRANLTKAMLRDTRLTRARLIHANLTDADLTRANLAAADITGADFTNARLDNAAFPDHAPIPRGWRRDTPLARSANTRRQHPTRARTSKARWGPGPGDGRGQSPGAR